MENELKYKLKSDTELVEWFQKRNDLKALGALYNRHMSFVYGVCLKHMKDAEKSQDLVMEIFELLIRRLPGKTIENFQAWLYRVVVNHCIDTLRKDKVQQKHLDQLEFMQNEPVVRPIDEGLDEKEIQMQAMEDCLEELSEDQKACVQLFYLEEKSYDEIAEIRNISWNKTRSNIQNGRRNLRNCMEAKR